MLDGIPAIPFDVPRWNKNYESYLADWPPLRDSIPHKPDRYFATFCYANSSLEQGRGGREKHYQFEGEAAVGRFFSGLARVKRFGVPNRNMSFHCRGNQDGGLSMSAAAAQYSK
jgi:hypothetical protein